MTERHWIDNVADLISGRTQNTLVSLAKRVATQENIMTQNEQTITNAAEAISNFSAQLNSGIEALLARIDSLDGVSREDLSDELAMLTGAVSSLGSTASLLTPAEAPVPEDGGVVAGPIVHGEEPVFQMGGTEEPPAPGTTPSADPTTVPDVEPEPEFPVDEDTEDEGDAGDDEDTEEAPAPVEETPPYVPVPVDEPVVYADPVPPAPPVLDEPTPTPPVGTGGFDD